MKHIVYIFFLIAFHISVQANNELDSLLIQLEQQMVNRQDYDAIKQGRIIAIKSLIGDKNISTDQLFYYHAQLIKEYEAFIFDSALTYLDKNLLISQKKGDVLSELKTKISLANLLSSSGIYKDAEKVLSSINIKELPQDLKIDYYMSYRKVYSILSFYTPVNINKTAYKELFELYTDSVIQLLDKKSEDYLAIMENQFRDNRNLPECLKVNSERLAMTQMGDREYSMVTFERALAYELMGDVANQKKFLILSAISDIKASVKDNASLAALASLEYKEQELEKAYKYINFSYEDAAFFNSRLRYTLISNILPIINDAYQLKSSRQKKALHISLIVISVLSMGLFITVIFIYKQNKDLSRAQAELKDFNKQLRLLNTDLNLANNQLSESNRVKEHYIGNFLSICSNYIDKLDNYRKMVNKYLVKRQVTELFEKTKSSEFIEDETKEFYENFDTTFLHIFPNFVERINALLLDEEQFEINNDELLNTELRIFALIRLGISDSTKIATLLRYSVRTIYNYRVKIKNKAAVPRDEFEDFVMKIGAFSK